MKTKRKAQLQIGENVVILIIFFFLLVIAISFYLKVQKSDFETKEVEIKAYSLLDLKTMVASLPEILCSENGDITEGCIDAINANSMAAYWQTLQYDYTSREREYYRGKFKESTITIKKLDLISKNWTSWTIYNETGNKSSSKPVFIPVSIHNATSDAFDFGIVEVKRYG